MPGETAAARVEAKPLLDLTSLDSKIKEFENKE